MMRWCQECKNKNCARLPARENTTVEIRAKDPKKIIKR